MRKGIPDAIRAQAWQRMAKCDRMSVQWRGVYATLVNNEYGENNEIIERDLNRTFPSHEIFQERGGLGQHALFNVLKAYSVYDTKVGYCQGMGFIVSTLLVFMAEEEAFWLFVQLMKNYHMEVVLEPGFPQLQVYFHQLETLFRETLPKLHARFESEFIAISMYATQWFITLFLYSLPFDTCLRIWDIFLLEGNKVLFRVALAILKLAEPDLIDADLEKIMRYMANLPKRITAPDVLLPVAFSFRFKRSRLVALEREFREMQKNAT